MLPTLLLPALMVPATASTADGEFGQDGIGWLLLWELIKDVLRGGFIVFGPAMWVFIGVLGAFTVTRGITRFIRRRSASGRRPPGRSRTSPSAACTSTTRCSASSLMFLSGLLIVATSAQDVLLNVLALLFGIGVGLAFDEFALWLHLDDVYWSEQGRKSIDAVAIVLVITASVRAFLDILEVFENGNDLGDLSWLLWVVVAITVIPAVICVLKGKLVTAALGVVYQPIGFIGAFRLAKPESFWARHFYGADSRRRARAERRFGEIYEARWDRVRDLVGGTPTSTPVADPGERSSRPSTSRPGRCAMSIGAGRALAAQPMYGYR